jgi:ADP-ribosylglycohydrolase
MKTSEFIKESYDSEEYNDEAGMVKTNLHTIARMCEVLDDHLADDENMAEWAQEKIAVVKSMIVAVTDYVISQHEQGIQPTVSENTSTTAGAMATAPTAGKNAGTLFGGSYQQPDNPFKKKSTKKESVIKR